MKALFQEIIKEKDSDLILKKAKKVEILPRLDKILEIRTKSNSEEKLGNRFSKLKSNLFRFLVLLSVSRSIMTMFRQQITLLNKR